MLIAPARRKAPSDYRRWQPPICQVAAGGDAVAGRWLRDDALTVRRGSKPRASRFA
jgi:hypothetical protein